MSVDLRTRLWLFSICKLIENIVEALRCEILVIVVVDLYGRRVHARTQAFDFDPRKHAVRGNVLLLANTALAQLDQLIGTAQHARRGAADLQIVSAHRAG